MDNAYIPFSFKDGKQAKGMYIDVLKAVFRKMPDFEVSLTPIPWSRGKVMMKKGQGFGLAPAFFHGHDWPYLYPYSLPFYTETIEAICHEGTLKKTARKNWPDDYIGLKIGNVNGFDGWGGEKFRALVKEKKIAYFEVGGSEALIKMVESKRADCIMMEDKAFDFVLRKLKNSNKKGKSFGSNLVKSAIIGQDPVYIGYSKKKLDLQDSLKFRQAFDSALYLMLKNGEVEKIMDAYKD